MSLFGSFDTNVRLVEQEFGVTVVARGTDIKVSGEPEAVSRAVKAINGLLELINRGEQLNEQNVRYVLMLVSEGAESAIPQLSSDSICVSDKPTVPSPAIMIFTAFPPGGKASPPHTFSRFRKKRIHVYYSGIPLKGNAQMIQIKQ